MKKKSEEMHTKGLGNVCLTGGSQHASWDWIPQTLFCFCGTLSHQRQVPTRPMSPQDLESAFQPPLILTQGFLYFPQVCFSENEDDWPSFLMIIQVLRTRSDFYFSCLDQLCHVHNSLENTRLSPSEQPCQGQAVGGGGDVYGDCLNSSIPWALCILTNITLPSGIASCLLTCH